MNKFIDFLLNPNRERKCYICNSILPIESHLTPRKEFTRLYDIHGKREVIYECKRHSNRELSKHE